MASKRNKTLRLQGNTADVKDIQDVGLWDTVQAAPVGTREDGSKYNVRLPKGYSYVGYSGQLQDPEQVKHRGSWGGADNAHMGDENWSAVQKAKADWKTAYDAGDQAGMDAAHAAAEAIRAGYGYSGGADGSEYLPLMFKSEGYVEEDSGDGGSGRGGYGYPGFSSRYDPQIQALYQAILSREPFSYDAASDPLYGQYKQSYTRGGQRAMQDTLGQMALRTGGLASSYAESAAQQTYDNYMAALADKIPELQQLAYQRYQDELSGKRADLSMLLGLDDVDYNRWSGDRSFDYNAYRDGVSDEQWAKSFDYQQQRDAASDSQWQQQWDYSRGQEDYTRRLQLAQQYAELTGDYSGFLEAGWTPEQVAAASRAYQQQGAAAAAKGSGGSNGGGMKLSQAKEYAKQGIFTDEVLRVLRGNGYNDAYLKAAYGYEPEADLGALNGEQAAYLKRAFPDGVMDEVSWNELIRQGVREEDLIANGFTVGTAKPEESSGQTSVTGRDLGRVIQQAKWMQANGDQKALEAYINKVVAENLLSDAQYEQLMRALGW